MEYPRRQPLRDADAGLRRRGGTVTAAALFLASLALAAAPPQVRTHFYEIRHVMSCRVHVPPGYDPGRAYPLLIALHGRGGDPRNFDRLVEREPKVQCIVAAPEGPYALIPDGGSGRGAVAGRSWFLPVKDRRLWTLADPLVTQAMVKTAAELKASYRIGPVYILGFSQGASLAYLAALRHPEAFAGVLAVAGVFPEESLTQEELRQALPRLRVWIAHGSRDGVVSPRSSERARSLLVQAGFRVEYQSFRGGHTVTPELFRKILAWIGADGVPAD